MSKDLIALSKPKYFTRTLIAACCMFAMQSNAHASKNRIFVSKAGDAVIRIADTSGIKLTVSSGDKAGDVIYTLEADGNTTSKTLSGVTRNVYIRTGSGMDSLELSNLEVNKSLSIFTGAGSDSIEFFGLTVGRNMTVRTNKGDDVIAGSFVSVGGRTTIVTGNDNDTIEIGAINTARNLFVSTGAGNDFVDLEEMTTNGSTFVGTARGDDEVVLSFIENSKAFRLNTGPGNDNVELTHLDFSSHSKFALGAGDDTLELTESSFSVVNPKFLGGVGNDTFETERNNTFDKVKATIVQFEEIIDVTEPEEPPVMTYELFGEGPGGGIVFQLDDAGTSGLEIMPIDLTGGGGIAYGCAGTNVENVNDSSDGINDPQSGADKTIALLQEGCADAAMLASGYNPPNGSDGWFLPSAPELKSVIDQGIMLPNPGFPYWSSSEQSDDNAYQVFNTTEVEVPSSEAKTLSVSEDSLTVGVAPVRAFGPVSVAN